MLCLDEEDSEVHEKLCSNQIKPADIEPCNTQPCEFVWITGEWSEVSETKVRFCKSCHLAAMFAKPWAAISVITRQPYLLEWGNTDIPNYKQITYF